MAANAPSQYFGWSIAKVLAVLALLIVPAQA